MSRPPDAKFFDGKASVMTQKRQAKEVETQRLHNKTFCAWCNAHLKSRDIRINDLTEFGDGVLLIYLIEVLTGQKCELKYHPPPVKEIHKADNVAVALKFLNQFIKINCNPQDVVQGNMKVILSVIWRLVLNFQVENHSSSASESAKNQSAAARNREAKKMLLDWVKDKTQGYPGINIDNFETGFTDGMAFCAIVHKYDPSAFDFAQLNPANARENLALAFKVAEERLGIPAMLDANDMCNPDPSQRPDEQCIMTYLAQFPRVFTAQLQGLPPPEYGVAIPPPRPTHPAVVKHAGESSSSVGGSGFGGPSVGGSGFGGPSGSRYQLPNAPSDEPAFPTTPSDDGFPSVPSAQYASVSNPASQYASTNLQNIGVGQYPVTGQTQRGYGESASIGVGSEFPSIPQRPSEFSSQQPGSTYTSQQFPPQRMPPGTTGVYGSSHPSATDHVSAAYVSQLSDKERELAEKEAALRQREAEFQQKEMAMRRKEEEWAREEAERKQVQDLLQAEQMRTRQEYQQLQQEQERLSQQAAHMSLSGPDQQMIAFENQRLAQELSRLRGKLIGTLKIIVIQARALMGVKVGGKSNPYVIISVDRQREKTRVVKRNLNPIWESEFKFFVSDSSWNISLTVFSESSLSSDDFLGRLDIPIRELRDGQPLERWFALQPKKPGGKVSGEIKLFILYTLES